MRGIRVKILGSVLIAALLVVGACGNDDSTAKDTDLVEQLVDEHHVAWVESDPARISALFTEDGVFTDTIGQPSVGREEIAAQAELYAPAITAAERTGPVEAREDGTFVFGEELSRSGATFAGERVVTIRDGLFASYEWVGGTPS